MEELEIVLEQESSNEVEIILEQESSNEVEIILESETGSLVEVKNHHLEGTNLIVTFSNGQTLVVDISEYIDAGFTIAEIEELIISNLENKTVEEVEA